jgi:dCMP deaminase
MHCGCVLVKDKQILSTGYNGSIPGDVHCDDDGCMIVDNHCVRTIHAEMNAILQCSSHGVNTKNSIAYVTNMPCTNCAKSLIAAGVKEVVIFSDYHDTLAEEFFQKANVPIKRLNMPGTIIDYDLSKFTSAKKTEKSL